MARISYLWVQRTDIRECKSGKLIVISPNPPAQKGLEGTLGISPSIRGFNWWFTHADTDGFETTMSGTVGEFVSPKELVEFIKNKPADKPVKFVGAEYFPDESPYAIFEY
jgi:hypothetical protein